MGLSVFEQLALAEVTVCLLISLEIQMIKSDVTRIACQLTHQRNTSRGTSKNCKNLNCHQQNEVVDPKMMLLFSRNIISFVGKHVKSRTQNTLNDGVNIVIV